MLLTYDCVVETPGLTITDRIYRYIRVDIYRERELPFASSFFASHVLS
jgi:hypothetical protein